MKTLYVSDLDGTLLHSDQRTSDFTNRVIGELVEQGMLFSYATARSYVSSHRVTAGLTARIPVILYNGTSILDSVTGEMLLHNFFPQAEVRDVIRDLLAGGVKPIVYAYVDGAAKFSYLVEEINPAVRDFVATRPNDPRDRPVHSVSELLTGEIFYITCIDEREKLIPFYEKYEETYHCVSQRDIYSGEWWLELMPRAATKANAIRQLAQRLACDHIVVFGDGVNDMDMFRMADEAYAVENAVPELKALADGIIGSNDADGVARWLYRRITGRDAE